MEEKQRGEEKKTERQIRNKISPEKSLSLEGKEIPFNPRKNDQASRENKKSHPKKEKKMNDVYLKRMIDHGEGGKSKVEGEKKRDSSSREEKRGKNKI